MAIRELPKILMAPGPRQSADLGQDIFRSWGVHMKMAEVWLNAHLGKHPNAPVGESADKWLTALGQLAAEAARLHPKQFAAFCQAFLAGPGGNWAKPSTHVEALARTETALQLESWWDALLKAGKADPTKSLQELIISAYLVEMRIRPLLLAIAYLVRLVRDGPAADPVKQLKDAFFTTREEKWGALTRTVDVLIPLDGAYSEAANAMASAKASHCLPKETRLGLVDLLESLSNDEVDPSKTPEGGSNRLGLNTMRNQVFHGNTSHRDGGGYALNYAAMFAAMLDGKQIPQLTMSPAGIEENVGRLFGLSALLGGWEGYMTNVHFCLDTWGLAK